MDTLLVAIAAVVVGLLVAAFGTRQFSVLLPLWGFLAGLFIGADLVASLGGDRLFSTLAGWLAGAALGIVLAAVSALWFTGGMVILGIGLGTTVVSGLLNVAGVEPGLVTLGAGVVAGAGVGLAVILADLPATLIAAVTAYGGAMWLTTGLLLLLGRIGVGDLHGIGPAGVMRGDAAAVAVAFVLGTVAFAVQARDLRRRGVAAIERGRTRF